MNIPEFDDIFKQIKTNFWIIGIPFDQPEIKLRYFILFFTLLTTVIEEFAFFCTNISAENFLQLTQLAPYNCCGWLTVIKILFITSKRQKIFDLTRCLKELYDIMLTDSKKQEIVRRDFAFLKCLVKYFFILNIILISVCNFSTLIFISYHYFTEKVILYRMPYAVVVPFSTDVWYTWLIVYLHSISSGFICVLDFMTVDALYYILTSHVCAQFALLSDEIKYLDKNTSHCLREIVKKHQYILKLSQDLEEIFRGPNLFNVLVGSIEICALGFNLTMGPWAQTPSVVLFLLSILLQILMISSFGENLIRESRKVGEAAFFCKWYDMDKMSKKIIYIIILRSNKPQKLTAYKFSVISYESFTKIISNSWSYFTILKTVYTQPEVPNGPDSLL